MRNIVDGNKACAEMAYLFSEIASIYPITPSSPMASSIDAMASHGYKNLFGESVQVIEMQSEAGAAGTLHGALLAGSLATTFTASQGLLLMIPNMYKIAGECLPTVIHVAARTVATHALSIFGDHSDVYAVRETGFCMLASSSVEQANHMAAVAHLSALKGSLPFVHFFDGFRTSHEINTVSLLGLDDIRDLIPFDEIQNFKSKSLSASLVQRGMAENEDIYFQSVEARNGLYMEMPSIVSSYMDEINKIAGTDYKPFNYYGVIDAENVIVAMGSVCDTIKLVVADLIKSGHKVGLIEVHLYRPFSSEYLLKVLPDTVKRIAVLDRTKEAGSIGEPLYLDICCALKGKNIEIVGGRYGLSSKDTTPDQIVAVYRMLEGELKNNFTIGIVDDVTYLSLNVEPYKISLDCKAIKIFGFGSDGMVSTSKDIMKIIGKNGNKYVQGYNQYDSKKSGGVTICNLRIGEKPIHAPYSIDFSDMVVCTKEEYLFKFSMLDSLKDGGIFVLNTEKENINGFLPNSVKKMLVDKKIRFYVIDANRIADEVGIKGKISKIMEIVILYLLNYSDVQERIFHSIDEQFGTKGDEVVAANKLAVSMALDHLHLIDCQFVYSDEENSKEMNVFDRINARCGDSLTVKDLLPYREGIFPCGLSKYEKRKTSVVVPKWNSDKCIQCGQCALVCPHAVIRPFVRKDIEGVSLIGKPDYKYEIVVSEADCTSCGLCINVCPGKGGEKALVFGKYDEEKAQYASRVFDEKTNPELFSKYTVKGSQMEKPKFEFSGACAGCGETPYIKLLTQLFGNRLLIANATGCSSIYGGSVPSTPYSISWANSLFEDNAEFGFGMLQSYKKTREHIVSVMKNSMNVVSDSIKSLFNKWLDNRNDYVLTLEVKEQLEKYDISDELRLLLPFLPARSVWTIGGDGWAYDIGFGGIDHVLSSGENVNILVLDTEVYSNTGGQASKSSHFGQVAEFADTGKKTAKKDLFRIAMCYPNCYVASVSLGANFMQTIKAFKEAEEHVGPSIIIAYSPCVEQGIKGGMCNAISEQKLVVDCGYMSLMRYNPVDEKLYIDSREPNFDLYESLLKNEVRYSSLLKKNPKQAMEILELNKVNAERCYAYYKKLSLEDKN